MAKTKRQAKKSKAPRTRIKSTKKTKQPPKKSLKSLVGKSAYAVWCDMLRRLVPDGRTHRIAPLIAGMLQHASNLIYEESKGKLPEGSLGHMLVFATETGDPTVVIEDLTPIVIQLFKDAGVPFNRSDHQGEGYSIIESAILDFFHWYDMPWE